MDPLYERRLRDEVIYLHSLWYQGPPRPAAASATATRYSLQPSQSIHFKKVQKRRGISGNVFSNNATHDSSSSHDAVWPCPPNPPPPAAWPASSGPTPEPLSLSADEQLKLDAKGAHHHALKAVHDFLISNNADGFDEIDSSDDDDGDRQMDEDCGHEEYSFFCKMFEDTKLRQYYEKNFVVGEFSCLVCGAVGGKKTAKRFNGCLPLVQHSMNIEKAKRRAAHRAFAQAVCKVLGWDIHHLPKIVSMPSDKSGNAQGNGDGKNKESSVVFVHNVDSVKDDEAASASDAGKKLEDVDILHTLRNLEEPASDGLKIISLTCADSNKNLENPGMVYQQSMEEPASQGLTTNSLFGPDADNNENSGIVHREEQSASERSEINSLVGPDADNNENLGILLPMEQPASEGSKINSLAGPDADNHESLGVVRQVEQPASERSKINSLVGPDADNNENLGILHQMEQPQPASEGSMIISTCSDADRNSGNDNLHAHNLEDQKTE